MSELSVIPMLTRAVIVTRLRSLRPSLSVLLHTSPNRTSSLSSANFGAKSPSWSRPAVCTTFPVRSVCSVLTATAAAYRIVFVFMIM